MDRYRLQKGGCKGDRAKVIPSGPYTDPMIVQGAQGLTGVQGETGIQGQTGIQGITGLHKGKRSNDLFVRITVGAVIIGGMIAIVVAVVKGLPG